ncbi:MAG: hypothetical protein LBI42_09670 [Chitinispirillales bacterium]|jgi:hypothetical protein|nr:hypothetical protein [Chitinispirillales bacterium]
MKETARNRILSRIYGHGKGWVFSAIDFLPDLKRWEIDRFLTDLAKEGKIARILPGLYYYPEYSKLLQKNVAPDVGHVAYALARKYDWKIQSPILSFFTLKYREIPPKAILARLS